MKTGDIVNFIKKNSTIIISGIILLAVFLFISKALGSTGSESDNTDLGYEEQLENELSEFISQLDGVGQCQVMIIADKTQTSSYSSKSTYSVNGIAVICEGGGNVAVKTRILEVLTRLFGISGSRISINEKQ